MRCEIKLTPSESCSTFVSNTAGAASLKRDVAEMCFDPARVPCHGVSVPIFSPKSLQSWKLQVPRRRDVQV